MANSSGGGNLRHLDTSKFHSTISAFKKGITEYNTIKTDVERTTNELFISWLGEGKVQFEKNYTTLYRQLTDIADIMYELYDALVEAEAAYIEADQQSAKQNTM